MKILLLIALFSLSASAQVIRWTVGPNGSNYMSNGSLVTSYEDAKLRYDVTLYPDRDHKYVSIFIGIVNKTDTTFTVFPEQFEIRLIDPKGVRVYKALPDEVVVKEIGRRGAWRTAMAQGLAGIATQQSTATVTDSSGNTANVVVTTPDAHAQTNARNATIQQSNENAHKAAGVTNFALRSHTLFPKHEVYGSVYFRKKNLTPGLILAFSIDGITYEVPYGTERQAQTK